MKAITEYVTECDGDLLVRGSRVGVVALLAAWRRGESAEQIARAYPALRLEQVEGVLAYYRERPDEVERALGAYREMNAQHRADAYARDPEWHDQMRRRLEAAQRERSVPAEGESAMPSEPNEGE